MTVPRVRIDIVSDVVCPWCAIGLAALDCALAAAADVIAADIVFHPFELNPDMPPEGEPIAEHVARKYGFSPEQARAGGGRLRDAAAAVGLDMTARSERIVNTFDAHRLLHWAMIAGRQAALKRELLAAYFARGADVSDRAVLVAAAQAAGLDADQARTVLETGRFADEVRAEEAHWRAQGITAVPTMILDERYVVQGAQEPARLERALRRLAAELTAAA